MFAAFSGGSFLQVLLLAGGLTPGWLLGRALQTRAGLTGAFIGSVVLIYSLVLALDAFGLRINAVNMAAALVISNCGILALPLILPRRGTAAHDTHSVSARDDAVAVTESGPHHRYWLILPAALGIAAVLIHSGLAPLSGWDTPFRWDFLAQQMLSHGSLQFYPPVSSKDFLLYGWCDGIAPIVSSHYLWSYLCVGEVTKDATTPIVWVQALLIFRLVWLLTARRAGPLAGSAACALLATSSTFLWSVSIGQETGLTALSMLALFWFVEKVGDQPLAYWAVWAGLAAGAGGLAREYGLVLIPLGAFALHCGQATRRNLLQFVFTAAVVALPWYVRNALKTGHPLYSLDFGPLLPANAIHLEYMSVVASFQSVTAQLPTTIPHLFKLIALLAGLPVIIGLGFGFKRWRHHGPWLVSALVFVGLWVWSIPHTSGGVTYSMRVLTPAIAITSVLGGIFIARISQSRGRWILVALFAALVFDASARSLYLPADPAPPWWRIRPSAWRDAGQSLENWRNSPNWAAIKNAAEDKRILVSDPVFHAVLARMGANPVPLFSPEVRFLFTQNPDFPANIARLRANGFRFILISRENPFIDTQLARHPFFQALRETPPIATLSQYFVYDVYALHR